jgi:hypothetical protein
MHRTARITHLVRLGSVDQFGRVTTAMDIDSSSQNSSRMDVDRICSDGAMAAPHGSTTWHVIR